MYKNELTFTINNSLLVITLTVLLAGSIFLLLMPILPAHADLPFLSKLHKLANGNYELPSGIIIDKNGFLVIKNKTQIHTLHFASIQSGANGTVSDGPSCQRIGGTWDQSSKTCTVTSLVVNSPDKLTISGNITLSYNNLDISGKFTIMQGSSTYSYNLCNPDCGSSFTVDKNGLVNNSGNIYDLESSFTISGTLDNLGSIYVGKGSIFGDTNSTIDNQGQIIIDEAGFESNGIFINHKTLSNSDGAIGNNGANFINDGNITQDFNAYFINNGTIINNVSGKFANIDPDNNGALLENLKIISNFGNITNGIDNEIDNNDTINNQCGIIFNSGTFFGNAINNISCKQTQMNDNVASYGATTNSANQLQTEFASPSSILVGKPMNIIIVDLKKVGSPSGTIQIGVFNSDRSVKQLFGTKSASSLTSLLTKYSFSLPVNQIYNIHSGDRIGVKYTGGSSSNYVDVGTDQTNSFDGTNSYLMKFTTSWQTFTSKDLTMTLKVQSNGIPVPSSSPTSLIAKASSSSQISLSWTAPTNNGGSTITGYKIERGIGQPCCGFSIIANTHSTATTFVDSGLTANTTYTYRVSAINSAGFGDVSNNAFATTTSTSGPAVSASPTAGTYNSLQSVTLTATVPSTIFYTTDGSTPTTSSPNGSSPVTGIIISKNSTLNFFAKDGSGNIGPAGSAQYVIVSSKTTIIMNDTVISYGATTNSANSLQTEYASNSSALVGKSIDTIIVDLKKVGSPSGTIQIGVFNSDQSVKQLFGTKDASSLTSSQVHYSLSLPTNQTYQIQSGDRIGVKYTGGSSSNYVDVGHDQTNSFDGINSYLMKYTTLWQTFTDKDLTMTLTLH